MCDLHSWNVGPILHLQLSYHHWASLWLMPKPLYRLCSHGLDSRSERRFRTWFDPFLIWKPDFSPCEHKAVSNQAFEMRFETRKKGRFGSWTQSSFGTWFVCVHFGNVRWSHAWINQRGLRSRSKLLPHSAQILIVIGKAFTMHVNASSSIHDPNHVLDRDLKRLSERDSSPCEHSH